VIKIRGGVELSFPRGKRVQHHGYAMVHLSPPPIFFYTDNSQTIGWNNTIHSATSCAQTDDCKGV
jgi:hypothetical protein